MKEEIGKIFLEIKIIIGNMIEAFKRDEKLGICIPPLQIDEKSYLQIADGWGNYFSKVKDILKQKEFL